MRIDAQVALGGERDVILDGPPDDHLVAVGRRRIERDRLARDAEGGVGQLHAIDPDLQIAWRLRHGERGPAACAGEGIAVEGGRGDGRAQHAQARGLFKVAVDVRQGQIARGGLRIERIDGHLDTGDAGDRTQGDAIGHDVHTLIDKNLVNPPAARGQRHVALRAQGGVVDRIALAVKDHRLVRNTRRINARRHRSHHHIAGGGHGDVVGVGIGARAHIDQIDRTARVEREAAVGQCHFVQAQGLGALRDKHIAGMGGVELEPVDLSAQRRRRSTQTAGHRQLELVGLDGLGRVEETQRALHQEADVAAAHQRARAAASAELPHRQVGRRAGRARLGAHQNVIAVAQALGHQVARVHMAGVGDGDRAVEALGPGDLEIALVVQHDGADVGQAQVHLGCAAVQGDSSGGAGHHAVGHQQAAGQALLGEHIVDGDAAREQGLQHAALGRAQRDDLVVQGGVGCGHGQRGVGQADIAALKAGAGRDARQCGRDLGVGIGREVARLRNALSGLEYHSTSGDAARELGVAAGLNRHGGGGVGGGHAAQADVAVRLQQHRGRHLGGSILRGRDLGGVVDLQQQARLQVHGFALQGRADGPIHPVDQGGGQTAHAQGVAGLQGQRRSGLHLATEAGGAAGVHRHVIGAQRGIGFAKGAGGGRAGVNHRLEHRLGGRQGPGFPDGDAFKRDLGYLLARGLLDGQLFEQGLVDRDQLEALLNTLVVDRLPLGGPSVGVVGVVFLDDPVELPATPDLVGVKARAALLAGVVGVDHIGPQVVVAPVRRNAAGAGPAADIEATALDNLVVNLITRAEGVVVGDEDTTVANTGIRLEKLPPVAGPVTALLDTPASRQLPVAPVFVVEAKLVEVRGGADLAQRSGVKGQRVDVGIKSTDAVGEAAQLPEFHGIADHQVGRGFGRRADVIIRREPPVGVGIEGNLVAVADGVDPLRVAAERGIGSAPIDIEGALAGIAPVTDRPGGASVFPGRVRLDAALLIAVVREIVAGGDLVIEHLAVFLVAAHQLAGGAGAHGGPGSGGCSKHIAVVEFGGVLQIGLSRGPVLLQELSLPGRFDPQDIDVCALGHAHIAVAPAVDVDEIHHLGGAVPGRCVGLVVLHHPVLGALDDRVAVAELEQRHIAGVLEHGGALRVIEAGEIEVGGLVAIVAARGGGARVGPSDRAVVVIQALSQHLEEAALGSGVRVVVADLGQHHIHGGVLGTNLEFLVLNDLGDCGGLPGHNRHLNRSGGHLLVADHLGHGFSHRGVALDRHRARAGHHRVGAQGDIATGLDHDGAVFGRQPPLAGDADGAADQRALGDRAFQGGARPGHVDTGVEVDVAVGGNETPRNRQALAGVEQNSAVVVQALAGHARLHDAIDRGHRRQQVHQLVGQDQRVVVGRAIGGVAARDFQHVAGTEIDLRVLAGGVHIAAGQHADVAAMDFDVVAHVDVAVDQHISAGRLQAQQTHLGLTQVLLADHALDVDAVGGGDGDGAAGGSIERATGDALVARIKHQGFNQNGYAALVNAGRQAELVIGHQQGVDHNARTRAERDVGTHVGGDHRAGQPDIAVTGQRDAPVRVADRLGPDRRRAAKFGRGVRSDGAGGRHLQADAADVRAGIDGDRAGGPEIAAVGGLAQQHTRTGHHIDVGALAAPDELVLQGIEPAVAVGVFTRIQDAVGRRGAGIDRSGHTHGLPGQRDQTVVGLAVEHRVGGDGQVAAGRQGQGLVGFQAHAAAGGAAHRDVAQRAQRQVLTSGRRAQTELRRQDVTAGIDQQRAGQREVAAQLDVARGADADFFVIGGDGGQAAAHHALDDHVLALERHQRAGLQPAAALGQGQRAAGRADVEPAQVRIALADDAVDHHIIQAGEHDAPARIARDQLTGARGQQAGLGAADGRGGAGGDDDVALRFQATGDLQRLLGVDDDVCIAAQRHQLAFNHGVAGRAEQHAAAQGLQAAAGGQAHVLRAGGARLGVELDRLVGPHIARHGHRAGFKRRVADQHLGAALAGVNGGQAG